MAKKLPVAIDVPEIFRDPLREMRELDVRIVRLEGMKKVLAKLLERAKEDRGEIFGGIAGKARGWLNKTKAPKTLATPEATFKRRARKKGKIRAPSRNDEKEELVTFLLDRFPNLVTEEIVYDYSWSTVEPVVTAHMEETGELPFASAIYEPPGETFIISTIEKKQADEIASSMLAMIQEDEDDAESTEETIRPATRGASDRGRSVTDPKTKGEVGNALDNLPF